MEGSHSFTSLRIGAAAEWLRFTLFAALIIRDVSTHP